MPEGATAGSVGRFEFRGELGSGAFGIVYRVHDRARGVDVALKTLTRLDGTLLYRFKREFRCMADLQHPNLIDLHDLFRVGDEWMFTMELVDGVSFIDHVQGDEAKLRDALYQLADGLAAIHAAGKLHRDLKPSNVLVEPGGRVVILDFGLAADLGQLAVERTHERVAVGTPAYMSPEQAADQPLDAATDWYSVGVMLYQALTGRRPFEGLVPDVLASKMHKDPRPPGALVDGLPDDLEALCLALLERNPRERAGHAEVLATLGRAPSEATERIQRGRVRAPLLGRDEELGALKTALADSRDHFVTVLITGPAGSGKTALLSSFLERVRRAGALVLPGRIVESESLPLPALDQIADALCGTLMRLPAEEAEAAVPADRPLLKQMFPVLRRVPGFQGPTLPGHLPTDPTERMLRAADALGAIIARLAATRPVVVAIDDMQWGDEREMQLVHRQTGPDAPRILNIAVMRTEPGKRDPRVDRYLSFQGDIRHIVLGVPEG
jgi:tRNA A-37 threonylcarbamoyl transferase component Bud32